MDKNTVLEIKDLRVKFPMGESTIHAVNGVNLKLRKGETLGVVGESGCGKSVMMSSILRLVPTPPAITTGEILYGERDVLKMEKKDLFKIRGDEITMIFQEPMTSLNPVIKIGSQIAETLRLHQGLSKEDANEKVEELLKQVEIPNPKKRMNEYPHQLSGGMRQRVMIAMALACKPKILLADEPTTALDVTIQAQILALLKKLRQEYEMSVMLVTHDLGVIAEVADRVVVFYGGNIVEEAETIDLFDHPLHPYTEGLFGCIPHINAEPERLYVIGGNVPDPANLPEGCPFAPRCQYVKEACHKEKPALLEVAPGHFAACHFAKERLVECGGAYVEGAQ
ncbi:ABC transporter ATP-binding protein [Christensenellaceae bacterium OttesenSCG-928-M15]|nr:ABC transporter ATP-binding protein [Christensenellaceae bacterium OttesenSCG-928-M15]